MATTPYSTPGDEPRATVRIIDGQYVLDDPVALEVMTAVNKANCRNTLLLNQDRVRHFVGRISELGLAVTDWVIVVLNVDSGPGAAGLAEALMPGQSVLWQGYRDQGMVPFARGLANREGIQKLLDLGDIVTGAKLRGIVGAAVLVMDYGVAEVFDVSEELK